MTCEACGHALSPSSLYCPNCGHIRLPGGVDAPADRAPSSAPTSARAFVLLPDRSRAEIPPNGSLRIGRDADGVVGTALATLKGVSRAHAEIAGGNPSTITDLNSSNGTFLAGRRLQPGVSTPLNDGDVIGLGATVELRFEVER